MIMVQLLIIWLSMIEQHNFNFKPGNGFWLLSKNPINVNAQVNFSDFSWG